MIGIPFINDLFTNILLKSNAIKGRFFICPKLGTEINSDELGQVIQDLVIPNPLEKKYPITLMMPPVCYGSYTNRSGEWENWLFNFFFLTSTYYSGTNQIMSPNISTGTSTHTIPQDWHDMKRCAVNFITSLDMVIRSNGLMKDKLRIDQSRQKIITHVSNIGTDRASGVRLQFGADVFNGCVLEDYSEGDISSITIPEDDSHPEHQL